MRIRVHQWTRFRFETPVKFVIQSLRLTPRNHDGQHVVGWRIDLDVDCRLIASEDAFGNLLHTFSCPGPIQGVTIEVAGEVDTIDSAGLLRGAVERLPPELFLRETSLTASSPTLRAFAETAAAGRIDPLERLHALLAACSDELLLDTENRETPTATATIERGAGTSIDLAHVFVAAARHLGIPARFIGGYVASGMKTIQDGEAAGTAGEVVSAHAWTEAYVAGLGWVGFDAALGLCPKDTHVRVASGLDHLDAMPIRAARYGFARAFVHSDISVTSTEQ